MPPATKPRTTKKCSKCGWTLFTDSFGAAKTKDGLTAYCKECNNTISKKWREEHPERRKEIADKFHKANPEYADLYAKNWHAMNPGARAKYMAGWLSKDYRRRLWLSSRGNACTNGIEHSIKVKDIPLPVECVYLGITLNYRPNPRGKGIRDQNTPSIDRIDPSKGYVLGNIQVISDLANKMKQNATPEQLIAFAKGALRIHAGIEIED